MSATAQEQCLQQHKSNVCNSAGKMSTTEQETNLCVLSWIRLDETKYFAFELAEQEKK
jgi:hypothetical protein